MPCFFTKIFEHVKGKIKMTDPNKLGYYKSSVLADKLNCTERDVYAAYSNFGIPAKQFNDDRFNYYHLRLVRAILKMRRSGVSWFDIMWRLQHEYFIQKFYVAKNALESIASYKKGTSNKAIIEEAQKALNDINRIF